jgi:hypothetical protein
LRERIILAFKHDSDILQSGVVDFIKRSNNRVFVSMLASRDWFHFAVANEELAEEIVTTMFKKLNFEH